MREFLERYETWSIAQTLVPLAAAGLGAVLLRDRPHHLGKVVAAYAILCVLVALSPSLIAEAAVRASPEGAIPEVLLETKLAFVVGLIILLAAGGRARVGDGPTATQAPPEGGP
jgi:hypothetical protein